MVIGKAGKWFGPEEAMDYVAGYVIFNDITARDIQRREMESGVFSFCKAIDTFCPLGPWIVTPDEIPDPHDLAMELRVNGEARQVSHSSRMSVTIPEIISHYSALGYSAGDVLSTGTVSGVAGFSPDAASLYLKPGDVMEAEIEGIGVLRNPVISWQEAHGEPAPPRCGGRATRARLDASAAPAARGVSRRGREDWSATAVGTRLFAGDSGAAGHVRPRSRWPTLLVDTGVGPPGSGRPSRREACSAPRSSATSAEVDIVLITHVHIDHVGWNAELRASRSSGGIPHEDASPRHGNGRSGTRSSGAASSASGPAGDVPERRSRRGDGLRAPGHDDGHVGLRWDDAVLIADAFRIR